VTALTVGGGLALVPLLRVTTFVWIALTLTLYAFFSSSMTTMLDSMTLHRISRERGSYARIRLFGSIGYMLSSAAFGAATKRVDVTVVAVCIALWGATLLSSFTVRSQVRAGSRPRPWSGVGLLKDPTLRLLLGASMAHWVACMSYQGQFGIHVMELGFDPSVTGAAFAAGVLAEILVMAIFPTLSERWSPRTLLFVSFAASSARWLGLALSSHPGVVILLSTLHGLTFGVFFSASVSAVAARVPAALRTSGQALYVSLVFGLGGLTGNVLAGWLHERLGGHAMFAVAAAIELLPAAMVLRFVTVPIVVAVADPR
jgi:PPP family 3-phenylpropionic acid transporter